MSAIQRVRPKSFRKAALLAFLGLPRNSRWKDVAPLLKSRMVIARRNNDDERAVLISQIKESLKKTLKRDCRCGVIISPGSRTCNACKPPIIVCKRIKQRKTFLQKHYNSDWPVLVYGARFQIRMLLARFRVSRSTLASFVRVRFDTDLYTWINNHRWRFVKDALKSGRPMRQVIDRCGYSLRSSFYKGFKTHFHVTPSQFLKQYEKAA